MDMIKIRKAAAMLIMGALLVTAAGCDPQAENNKIPSSSTESTNKPAADTNQNKTSQSGKDKAGTVQEQAKTLNIEVYYPDDNGTKLVPVKREIEVNPYKDKYTAAVEMQMRAPKEKNLTDIFPQSAKLLSVRLEGETAVVDFDSKMVKGFVGGSTGEEMLVGSVVNTLTNFPEVKEVRFMLDGKPIETIAGHMDLSTPIKRMESLLQ